MVDLPLPVGSLVRRARNAKSPKERHDTAYFGWEASLRLLVALSPPADSSELAMPSVGHFARAARAGEELHADPALLETVALLTEHGEGRRSRPQAVNARRLFEALPAYRNAVIGHGSTRPVEFYEHAGEALLSGLEATWRLSLFWPPQSELVYAETVELDAGGARKARLLLLMGLASSVADPRGTSVPDTVLPRRVYARVGGQYRLLHPWILYEPQELQERILFFNGYRKHGQYLDYVSGEVARGKEVEERNPGLGDDLAALFQAASPERAPDSPSAPDPNRFGDYRILGKLGEGGMGVVYLARQESLDRLVALKMLPAAAAQDPVALGRFRREVTALSRCDHPNVVKVLASGTQERTPYYAMELIDGVDLEQLSRELRGTPDLERALSTASERARAATSQLAEVHGPPRSAAAAPSGKSRVARLAAWFRDAARALGHLHEVGLLHRDVKPANLMVTTAERRLVLMDFGLIAMADASAGLTRDRSSLLGTLRYMPPEQLQRNLLQLDQRADVYSLGATFYELLVGRPLFEGDSEARLIEQVLREEPVPPGRANPALPNDLSTIVQKSVEKDPRLRYQSMDALARDLEAFLEGRPISARPPTLWYLLGLAVRRNRALAAAIAIALLTGVAGTVAFVRREARLRSVAEVNLARVYEERAKQLFEADDFRSAELLYARALALADRPETRASLLRARLRAPKLAWKKPLAKGTSFSAVACGAETDRVALADRRGNIRLLDSGGQLLWATGEGPSPITALAVGASGTVVAGDGQGTLRALAAKDGAESWTSPKAHRGAVRALDVQEEGWIATGGEDGAARLWRPPASAPVASWSVHLGPVTAVAFLSGRRSPAAEGRPEHPQFASAGIDKRLELHEGELSAESLDSIGSLGASPDGRLLAVASFDGTVRLLDVLEGRQLYNIGRHVDGVSWTSFGPDRRTLASAGWDRTTRLYDLLLQRQVLKLDTPEEVGGASALCAQGRLLLTAGADGVARAWELGERDEVTALRAHQAAVTSIAAERGVLATAGRDGRVRRWDLSRLGSPTSPPGMSQAQFARAPVGWISSVAVAPAGDRVAFGGDDGVLAVWTPETGVLTRLRAHSDRVWKVTFDPSGAALASAGEDGTIALFSAEGGAKRAMLSGHRAGVTDVAFSPSGAFIASASSDGTLRVWEVASGAERATAGTPRRSPMTPVAFERDSSSVYAGTEDGRVYRIALPSFEVKEAAAGSSPVTALALVGQLRALAAGNASGGVLLLRRDSLEPIRTIEAHRDPITALWADPSSSWLVSGSMDRTLRVFEPTTGERVLTLEGHAGVVTAIAGAAEGRLLASGGDDGVVRLWNLDRLRHFLRAPPAELLCESEVASDRILEGEQIVERDASVGRPGSCLPVAQGGGAR
ncbi:MAG: protein kinase [Myxococcales bacterium]|nr:protein kinase [Myxococcales bacterium]